MAHHGTRAHSLIHSHINIKCNFLAGHYGSSIFPDLWWTESARICPNMLPTWLWDFSINIGDRPSLQRFQRKTLGSCKSRFGMGAVGSRFQTIQFFYMSIRSWHLQQDNLSVVQLRWSIQVDSPLYWMFHGWHYTIIHNLDASLHRQMHQLPMQFTLNKGVHELINHHNIVAQYKKVLCKSCNTRLQLLVFLSFFGRKKSIYYSKTCNNKHSKQLLGYLYFPYRMGDIKVFDLIQGRQFKNLTEVFGHNTVVPIWWFNFWPIAFPSVYESACIISLLCWRSIIRVFGRIQTWDNPIEEFHGLGETSIGYMQYNKSNMVHNWCSFCTNHFTQVHQGYHWVQGKHVLSIVAHASISNTVTFVNPAAKDVNTCKWNNADQEYNIWYCSLALKRINTRP